MIFSLFYCNYTYEKILSYLCRPFYKPIITMNFNSRNSQFSMTIVGHILMLNIIIWLATIALERMFHFNLTDLLAMSYWRSSDFHIFQPITYMFMHDTSNITHIFCNMFALFMFGRGFEQIWGGKKFLFFYLFSGLGAALIQQVTWEMTYQHLIAGLNGADLTPYIDQLRVWIDALATVGASGCIFGLLLAFGWMFPEQSIFLMFIPIPIPARWFVAGYAVIELIAGVGNFRFDNVAHFAHLGGMLFALFILLYWKKRGALFNDRIK